MAKRTLTVITYFLAGLCFVACLLSIGKNDIYQDGALANAQLFGQDIVTLLIALPFLLVVYIYKYIVSPLTPASCRHYPSCSSYSIEAMKLHGPFRGGWMSVKRISSCHPWASGGIDPVPFVIVKKLKFKNTGKTEKI